MAVNISGNLGKPEKLITAVILIVLALGVMVGLLPTLIVYIGNMSTISGLGFASFFATGGVILLALGAAVILGVLKLFGIGGSKR